MAVKTQGKVRVGLLGLGTVGSGAAGVLLRQGELLRRRLGLSVVLAGVAELDARKFRAAGVPKRLLARSARDLIADPQIDVVVELIGGIHPAKEFILEAMANGKHVVTANKALLAAHGEEIFDAAHRYGVDIGFEGSVGGGIPIIRVLREGLAANRFESIYGIINGTSNYILTQMTEDRKEFGDVLAEAKAAGYAEANPTLDVDGLDSTHKLAILVSLAFGTPVDYKAIYTEGITQIKPIDIEYAREFGYFIKLLAIAKRSGGEVEARVHPTMIPEDRLLAQVGGVYNAIQVVGDAVGETLYYGKGAGSEATASAVVGDIMEIARNLGRRAHGRVPAGAFQPGSRRPLPIKPIAEIQSLYYLRIMAQDRPGVLSKVSGILGKYNISISSVIQKGRKLGRTVPVVMMTHRAVERDVQSALAEINALQFVSGKTVLIRVEDEEG